MWVVYDVHVDDGFDIVGLEYFFIVMRVDVDLVYGDVVGCFEEWMLIYVDYLVFVM